MKHNSQPMIGLHWHHWGSCFKYKRFGTHQEMFPEDEHSILFETSRPHRLFSEPTPTKEMYTWLYPQVYLLFIVSSYYPHHVKLQTISTVWVIFHSSFSFLSSSLLKVKTLARFKFRSVWLTGWSGFSLSPVVSSPSRLWRHFHGANHRETEHRLPGLPQRVPDADGLPLAVPLRLGAPDPHRLHGVPYGVRLRQGADRQRIRAQREHDQPGLAAQWGQYAGDWGHAGFPVVRTRGLALFQDGRVQPEERVPV